MLADRRRHGSNDRVIQLGLDLENVLIRSISISVIHLFLQYSLLDSNQAKAIAVV